MTNRGTVWPLGEHYVDDPCQLHCTMTGRQRASQTDSLRERQTAGGVGQEWEGLPLQHEPLQHKCITPRPAQPIWSSTSLLHIWLGSLYPLVALPKLLPPPTHLDPFNFCGTLSLH